MSTASRVAHATYAAVTDPWLQSATGGGIEADPRANMHSASELHVSTPPVMAAARSNSANDNRDWDGSFEGHLGAYRRD